TFLDWMIIGIPFTILSFVPTFFLITRIFNTSNLSMDTAKEYVHNELEQLGSLSKGEKSILIVALMTMFFLVMLSSVNRLIGQALLSDSLIIMVAALSFFVIPIDKHKNKYVLQWSDTQKLSWGVLLLFGGALSLANMLSKTGLIELIGSSFSGLNLVSPILLLSLILLVVLIITEVIGGTALCSVFLPTALAIASSISIDLLYFTVPITLAANVAYLTPVGTAPNAIVFSKKYIHISDMVRAGIGVKIISALLLLIFITWWVGIVFG
ncbi:SLC13 family permease, partial [Bacteroidota bacterium]